MFLFLQTCGLTFLFSIDDIPELHVNPLLLAQTMDEDHRPSSIDDIARELSAVLGIPENQIAFVKQYHEADATDPLIELMALSLVCRACDFADDYFESEHQRAARKQRDAGSNYIYCVVYVDMSV